MFFVRHSKAGLIKWLRGYSNHVILTQCLWLEPSEETVCAEVSIQIGLGIYEYHETAWQISLFLEVKSNASIETLFDLQINLYI